MGKIKKKGELVLLILLGMNLTGYVGMILNKKNIGYQMNLSDYKTLGAYKNLNFKIITSMFIHENYKHLIVNMMILVLVYLTIKKYFNPWSIVMTYFVSGVVSNIVYVALNQGMTVGASGGVFGLLGLVIALIIKDILLSKGKKKKKMLVYGLVIVGILTGMFGIDSNVIGHVTGLSSGMILGIILVMTGKVNY